MALHPAIENQLKWHRMTLMVAYAAFLSVTIVSIIVGFNELASEEHVEEVSLLSKKYTMIDKLLRVSH